MQNIGFIGLGSIGGHMAKLIRRAGYPLTVYDINPKAVNDLEDLGAVGVNSPKQVGERSDIVFIMVQNFSQCESCLLGHDGLLEGMTKGVVIVSSTVSPDDIRKLEKYCEQKGIDMLDCPVSGGVKGASSGTLTLMLGGKEEICQECLPILEKVGSNIIRVGGEAGLGQAMKAVNQHLVSIHLAAMGEAMVLGIKNGLDPEMIYNVVKNSAGNSWMFEDKIPLVLNRDFSPPQSSLSIQYKDLKICLEMGSRTDSPMLLGNVCMEIYKQAEAQNLLVEDSSSIVKIYEELGKVLIEKGSVAAG